MSYLDRLETEPCDLNTVEMHKGVTYQVLCSNYLLSSSDLKLSAVSLVFEESDFPGSA